MLTCWHTLTNAHVAHGNGRRERGKSIQCILEQTEREMWRKCVQSVNWMFRSSIFFYLPRNSTRWVSLILLLHWEQIFCYWWYSKYRKIYIGRWIVICNDLWTKITTIHCWSILRLFMLFQYKEWSVNNPADNSLHKVSFPEIGITLSFLREISCFVHHTFWSHPSPYTFGDGKSRDFFRLSEYSIRRYRFSFHL